jgi:hypothetical protein
VGEGRSKDSSQPFFQLPFFALKLFDIILVWRLDWRLNNRNFYKGYWFLEEMLFEKRRKCEEWKQRKRIQMMSGIIL